MATKKQIGFYADEDVESFLDELAPGIKTKTINEAIRLLMKQHKKEPMLIDRVEALEKRVSRIEKKL